MNKPTMQEVLDAIRFASPGPDGGIEARIITEHYMWSISLLPTADGKLSLRMSGTHKVKRVRGLHADKMVLDEVDGFGYAHSTEDVPSPPKDIRSGIPYTGA